MIPYEQYCFGGVLDNFPDEITEAMENISEHDLTAGGRWAKMLSKFQKSAANTTAVSVVLAGKAVAQELKVSRYSHLNYLLRATNFLKQVFCLLKLGVPDRLCRPS